MSPVSLTIDGTPLSVEPGTVLLKASLDAGIHIPHACFDPAAEPPINACRICVVEIDGRIVTACTEPTTQGMVVLTRTPELERMRQARLQFPG